ncbi:MAG TPA: hypothetical protein PKD58_08010 [Candidatus Sumerlaeota bacterium]|nr:hypothetical protein [Candidatus Sumerlaeota bacterium]
MDRSDFELINRDEQPDGAIVYTLLIPALNITRQYRRDAATDYIEVIGEEKKIIVRGYDMSSIIGKRAREWIKAWETGAF